MDKEDIKKDIKHRALAGVAGSTLGYIGGAAYGVAGTQAKYLKDRRKYVKNKAKGKHIDKNMKKKMIQRFDNEIVPVKRIFPDLNSKKIRPRKEIYRARMGMEGARLGVTGLVKGMPYGIVAYSLYDGNKNRMKKIMKGDSNNGN